MDSAIDDALKRTAAGEAGLPSAFFHSKAVYALEVERFFRRQWFCIGLSSDASRPGDWYPVEVLGQSLLVARDSDGLLRIFYNVCSHRGAQLLAKPHHGAALVCPYHCWTYNLAGQLTRTPHAAGADRHDAPEIDRSRHGLRRLRAAEHWGLVFASFDEPSETFGEQVAPLSQRWCHVDFAQLECVGELRQRPAIQANWKIVVENFVESYHLPTVHPELNRVSPMKLHYQILGGDRYLGQGSEAYNPRGVYATDLPVIPGLEAHERTRGEAIYQPPNLLLIYFPDFMLVNIILPQGPTHTEERLELFVTRDAARDPSHATARAGLMQFMTGINNEDVRICESVQRGRASDAFGGGVFARRQETASLQFQQILARRLLEKPAIALPPLPIQNMKHPAPGERAIDAPQAT